MSKRELWERRVVYFFTTCMMLAGVLGSVKNVYLLFCVFALLPVWWQLRKDWRRYERDYRNVLIIPEQRIYLNRRNKRILRKTKGKEC